MRKTILTVLSVAALTAAAVTGVPTKAVKALRGSTAPPVNPQAVMAKAETANAFTLPLLYKPTTAQFANSIVVNANNDQKTWELMSGFLKYGYDYNNHADDWVFIPLNLTKEETPIKLTAEYAAQYSYDSECVLFAYGPEASPESMTTFVEVNNFNNTQFATVQGYATITGSGISYIGVKANSECYKSGIKIRNISIVDFSTPVPLSPEIVASSIDGLEYTAKVQMPAKTVQGKDIEGGVGLSIAVDGIEVENRKDCESGSTQDIHLTLTKGLHTIIYTAYLMDGDDKSESEPVADTVKGISNDPETLPYFYEPDEDQWDATIILDNNKDGKTWYLQKGEGAAYSYTDLAADDWLFLPVIDFGAKGGAFDITLEAKVQSSYCPESFEVCVGRKAESEGMSVVMSHIGITNQCYEEYSGKITIPEGGNWYVGIHCISDPNQYTLYIRNINIAPGADLTPAVPVESSVDFDGLSGTITYTLPSLTVQDKAITGNVGLIVAVDGTEVSRIDPQAPGSTVTVPLTLTIGNHTVSASAYVMSGEEELVGSPAVTRILARNPEGYAYPLPFEMRPTMGEFETLVTVDANNSGMAWAYNTGADNGKGAVMMRTTDDLASDAWIFFPQIVVEDVNRIYTVSADVRAYLEQFPEDFDICIGKTATPEAMTNTVVSKRGYNTYLYTTQAGEFIAPEAGNYVIGIHRISDGTAHTLSLCNVRMYDSGRSASAPVAPEIVSAISDATGLAKATITVTLPTTGINGNTLDTGEDLTATATTVTGTTATATGKPGETVTITIDAADGWNEITVTATSPTHGEGKTSTTTVFCGIDQPSAPAVSVAASEDNMSMLITWTDAERGANNGAVDTKALSHKIYVPTDATGEYWTLVAEVPAGTNSYTYSAPELQSQTIVGVMAVNDKGSSDLGLDYDITGAPYPLPMAEDFTLGRILYQPILTPTPTEEYTGWMFDDTGILFPSLADMPTALFCLNTAELGAKHSRLLLPKFSTEGSAATRLSLGVFSWAASPAAAVYAVTYGAEAQKIADINTNGDNKWDTVDIDLPASCLDKKWVSLYIEVDFKGGSEAFLLKSYGLRNIFDKQLTTTISAPDKMVVGDNYTITGRVANLSETAQALPAIKCAVGNITLEAEASDVTEIQPGQTLKYIYNFTPTADMVGTHKAKFELCDYTDQVDSDNAAETEIEIHTGNKAVVLDLTATDMGDGSVQLNWSEPEIKHIGDDDIESYEAFDYSATLGAWTNRDGDGKDVYGFQGVNFPGQHEAKAFQVVNTDRMPAGIVPEAYSGKQYLMAITPEDGSAADDWLISPKVVPGSKVSFRLNILSPNYGMEQIDLLWSSDGKDFTLLQTFSQTLQAWNPLEATLPAEANYFAFHYHCEDIFGVCLDDICYSPVSDSSLDSYHIYRNGSAEVRNHGTNSYLHTTAKDGDIFNVSVITRAGDTVTEHPLSNTVVAHVATGIADVNASGNISGGYGVIAVKGFNGLTASVHTPDGKTVREVAIGNDLETINVAAGIYMVTVGDITAKVIVK